MNPYEADPTKIPSSDLYADIPLYGRYLPRPSDFQVDRRHVNSSSTESLGYWRSVIGLCDASVQIYPADEGGRDVFALGSIVVKSSHLHQPSTGQKPETDYSYADANEVEATAIAKTVLQNIKVPELYFNGKIDGRQTLIQERLPGVTLNIAAPYLTQTQKELFKTQARAVIRQLHSLKPTDGRQSRDYVVKDPNILANGRLIPLEKQILFSNVDAGADGDLDLGFVHNDLTPSNCIVSNDEIVGLIDWEVAGFFGVRVAADIHCQVRSPQREHFTNAGLSEEKLQEIMWWNDLYDGIL